MTNILKLRALNAPADTADTDDFHFGQGRDDDDDEKVVVTSGKTGGGTFKLENTTEVDIDDI
jgi:hypothetical protein